VSGLKPTAQRLTGLDTPPEPLGKQEAVVPQPGPIARNVEDLVLAMEVLAAPGQQALDPRIPPVPWSEPADDSSQLRVGWFDDNRYFTPSPAIRRAVREAARSLAVQGAQVTEVPPPDQHRSHDLFIRLVGADRLRPTRSAIRGEKVHPLLTPLFMTARMPGGLKRLLAAGMGVGGRARLARLLAARIPRTPYEYFELLHDRACLFIELMASWDDAGVDVVVCPASGLPAPQHGRATDLLDATSYLTIANLLGLPAGVVPVTSVGADEESDRPPAAIPPTAWRGRSSAEASASPLPSR
jgi:fatty acid amide hydrolase